MVNQDASNCYTIVLTACIDPSKNSNEIIQVKRANPETRLQDYLQGLRFWLYHKDSRIKKIIFIDNSSYSLKELRQVAKKENIYERKIEFISMDCNEIINGLSYGYSEFKLLEQGLKVSHIINSEDFIIKATGRYIFPNISKLLDKLPSNYLFAGDSVDFYSVGYHKSQFIFFRSKRINLPLFIAKISFYNKFIRDIYQDIVPYDKKNSFIENALFKKIYPLQNGKDIILRFPCNCDPLGIGGNGTNYSSNRQKIIRNFRRIGRYLFPTWWF
jgi:hypothetical protein